MKHSEGFLKLVNDAKTAFAKSPSTKLSNVLKKILTPN